MDPAKVKAVVEWPQPQSVKQVQSFLGFANFYRQFIPDYSALTKPLTHLTKEEFKKDFRWNADASKAFSLLKSAFSTASFLKHFNFDLPAILETDCSDFALGIILSQIDPATGILHPVAFHSRQLTPAEINYDTHDKELLAVVEAFTYWRHYLISSTPDSPSIVYSDHARLEHFTSVQRLNRRQYRWLEKLSDFHFRILHRAGRLLVKPDALSRRADYVPSDSHPLHGTNFLQLFQRLQIDTLSVVTSDSAWLDRVVAATSISDTWRLFQEGDLGNDYTTMDGLLLFKDAIYLPSEELQVEAFLQCHSSPAAGHFGVSKTVELLSREYWFPKMRSKVRKFIGHCDTCRRAKPVRHSPFGLLQPLPVPSERWTDISMDFITDLPLSQGYDCLLVFKDRLTKMAHLVPTLKSASAEDVAQLYLSHIFRLHGLPLSIVSDRDPRFTGAFWKEFQRLLGTKVSLSTAFHPQTDGSTEVLNQVIEQYIRMFCSYQQDDWVNLLPLCEFSYNNSISSTTGMIPFVANDGRTPRFIPGLIRRHLVPQADSLVDSMTKVVSDLRANLSLAQDRYSTAANRQRSTPPTLQVGDLVFLNRKNIKTARPVRKFDDKFFGPFAIKRIINPVAYELDLPSSMRIHPVFHVSLLEPKPPATIPTLISPPPPDPVTINDEEEFEVAAILDSRLFGRRRQLQYLVDWKGYSPADRTWEPLSNVANSPDLLAEFHRKYPRKPRSL
jgi:RNase H-like domain found in reverse transcriptase/Integrase zinc binding domain/Chromo (CHRromatin Organisation MOdifier) domain